ncbi:MAG: asparaginase [Clostridiales bacterium]|nr:asparaginase [Clostridiales bacterium]MBQ2154879.1 asparaginase [Clostridiales bacterium]
MRILGAMLGGTISSYDSKGTVKLGEPSFARSVLLEKYPSHEFVFPEFKTYSSEDATPYLYRDALKKIVSEAPGFDGILITHGTDTCAFFAQLAARILGSLDIPFVITGSMRSPDKDPDEASGNLTYAVRCLEEGRSGVVFKNGRGDQQLYKAHLIMSPDINGIYPEYSEGILPEIRDYTEFLNKKELPKILVIPAVPGSVIPEDGFDRVLICCNHSGTASAGLAPMVERWTSKGIRCFMAPVPVRGGVYESRKILRDAGAEELTGMPVEGAWSEVLLR